MFDVGSSYTKKDIYKILDVPEGKRRGAWDRGLRKYEKKFFIFANVGIKARTGHYYDNYWDGDQFFWQAANHSNIIQPQVKELLEGLLPVYIFTRTFDKAPYTYVGLGTILRYEDVTPVRVVWEFLNENEVRNERLPEEIIISGGLNEGSAKKIAVNKFERNPEARRQCILHYGLKCQVCDFDFEAKFGELGQNFIHVHHINLLSTIGWQYEVNPITDLIPVCPNCHAMLHRKNPPMTVEELRLRIIK